MARSIQAGVVIGHSQYTPKGEGQKPRQEMQIAVGTTVYTIPGRVAEMTPVFVIGDFKTFRKVGEEPRHYVQDALVVSRPEKVDCCDALASLGGLRLLAQGEGAEGYAEAYFGGPPSIPSPANGRGVPQAVEAAAAATK